MYSFYLFLQPLGRDNLYCHAIRENLHHKVAGGEEGQFDPEFFDCVNQDLLRFMDRIAFDELALFVFKERMISSGTASSGLMTPKQ